MRKIVTTINYQLENKLEIISQRHLELSLKEFKILISFGANWPPIISTEETSYWVLIHG